MDRVQLEKLGDELRSVGHRRHELAERIFEEVKEGDNKSSKDLYKELSYISEQAIDIILRQKQMFDEEVKKM